MGQQAHQEASSFYCDEVILFFSSHLIFHGILGLFEKIFAESGDFLFVIIFKCSCANLFQP